MGDGEQHSLYAYQLVLTFIVFYGRYDEKTKSVPHNPHPPLLKLSAQLNRK